MSDDDQLLRSATGWTGPIVLAVTNHVNKQTSEHELERPFGLIGRSKRCDVSISKGGVAYRHAYLQLIQGQLLLVDCATDTGTVWEEGRKRADWLTPGRSVRIGDYTVQLASGSSTGTSTIPADFNPLKSYKNQLGPLPDFEIEFLNAQVKSLVVPLAHMLTLVGRHRSSKFHFDDESVSHVHASLLRTPDGLWVIDLLGRDGTIVNGKAVRFACIDDGDDLQIGRYRMKVRAGTSDSESALEDDHLPDPMRQATISTILITSNKVFVIEQSQDTLIITAEGGPKQFRYADIHHEANRALNLLEDPEIKNLVVDLSKQEIFTSVAIGVFNRLRNVSARCGGRSAICGASEQMQTVLRDMGLYGLWEHFPTREAAVLAFQSPKPGSE